MFYSNCLICKEGLKGEILQHFNNKKKYCSFHIKCARNHTAIETINKSTQMIFTCPNCNTKMPSMQLSKIDIQDSKLTGIALGVVASLAAAYLIIKINY